MKKNEKILKKFKKSLEKEKSECILNDMNPEEPENKNLNAMNGKEKKMKYAVVKMEMSNIIAWSVATREDLEKGNIGCEIVSWFRTRREANKNCPRYVLDKHAK